MSPGTCNNPNTSPTPSLSCRNCWFVSVLSNLSRYFLRYAITVSTWLRCLTANSRALRQMTETLVHKSCIIILCIIQYNNTLLSRKREICVQRSYVIKKKFLKYNRDRKETSEFPTNKCNSNHGRRNVYRYI